jgi:hypothetical protein
MTNAGNYPLPKYVVRFGLAQYISHPYMDLTTAILKTLSYSDVFDHPLTLEEVHRYLVASAFMEEIANCLAESDLIQNTDGYYHLAGRSAIVQIRKQREALSRRAYERAQWYGRILGRLPFVRMVALTGSLAMRNGDQNGDYDYMLVTKRGRVWMARIFSLLLNRTAHIFGETLCPNLIVSETMLEWKQHNLYYAREIAQMIPISGRSAFIELRVVNSWIEEYLPNWDHDQTLELNERTSWLQKMCEFFLGGSFGDRLESWEMNRKIRKFSRQAGFGIETNFNAEICQGNFDHHGMQTLQRYEERLRKLNLPV